MAQQDSPLSNGVAELYRRAIRTISLDLSEEIRASLRVKFRREKTSLEEQLTEVAAEAMKTRPGPPEGSALAEYERKHPPEQYELKLGGQP
jgi:hypothetical protein